MDFIEKVCSFVPVKKKSWNQDEDQDVKMLRRIVALMMLWMFLCSTAKLEIPKSVHWNFKEATIFAWACIKYSIPNYNAFCRVFSFDAEEVRICCGRPEHWVFSAFSQWGLM